MDLPFVLSNLASLTGLPVRRVKDGVLDEKMYSVVFFPVDPFSFHLKDARKGTAHISFFNTADFFYYGILKKEKEAIVIGPTSSVGYSSDKLKEILFRIGITNSEIESFTQSLSALPCFPFEARTRVLLRVNYIWNDEKLSSMDVLIQGEEQIRIGENRAKEEDSSEKDGNDFPHNTYAMEKKRLEFVKEGDVDSLKQLFESERPLRSGTIAQTPIRQRKNTRIVVVSLVSRTCIEGGRGVEEAFSLSDRYLQECERRNSAARIQNLTYHRIRDYASKRSEIKGTDQYSRTIKSAIAIIQHHVNKKISIQDIAKEVYLSQNRLQIRFKEETGKTIHDYRIEVKRKEAKRLLLDTKQTIEEISGYLCFSSQSYFQNVFKKETNRTPHQFREYYQKEDK